MKNYDAASALPIILQAAKDYDKKLKDRHFLIVYRDKAGIESRCVGFRSMHFLHLTGVKTGMPASMFYSACLSGRISVKDISVDTKGKAQQKLAVLPYLSELLYHNCMIGDFIGSGISIKADYFVGDTRAVLSVGFREHGVVDIPVTLYKDNVKSLANPTCKVLAIFSKLYYMSKFNECTYLVKGYEAGRFPEVVRKHLDESLYADESSIIITAIRQPKSD